MRKKHYNEEGGRKHEGNMREIEGVRENKRWTVGKGTQVVVRGAQ